MRKKRKIPKQQRPIILWSNRVYLSVWEIIIKGEIEAGFWSKSKFNTVPYLVASAIIYPKSPGTTIIPSLVGFNFASKKFTAEHGYYVSIIIKLALRYDISIEDLRKLVVFADSLIAIDYMDDNSDYRRVQVTHTDISEKNIPDEYKNTLGEQIKYFRNLGIDMNDVVFTLRDQPLTKTQIRKVLDGMSRELKKVVKHEDLIKLSKS